MSDEPKGELQFDRADYGDRRPAGMACAGCGQGVWGVYYTINGQVVCERCHADFALRQSEGSGAGRFLKASLYGTGAGALGAAVWYAVRAVTSYELGLIAIGVGFLVGLAVRKGSNGRGGWRYQALAMFLTYASIVSTYVPLIVSGFEEKAQETRAAAGASASPETPAASRSALATALFLVFAFAFAFVVPFLGGLQNLMGLVIIGIALYEAWKINRAVSIGITGPHRVATEPAGPVEPGRG
jgi:hypothetical protein